MARRGRPPVPLEERFWPKISSTNAAGCREWLGQKDRNGYGSIGLGRKRVNTHRLAMALHLGLDLDDLRGLCVCHKCDNPACCEPSHLFLGTQRDNIHDAIVKGRRGSTAGELNCRSKLTAQAVQQMRELRKAGRTFESIGAEFGVKSNAARKAALGLTWRHVQ